MVCSEKARASNHIKYLYIRFYLTKTIIVADKSVAEYIKKKSLILTVTHSSLNNQTMVWQVRNIISI